MDVSVLPFWPRDRYIELAPRYVATSRRRPHGDGWQQCVAERDEIECCSASACGCQRCAGWCFDGWRERADTPFAWKLRATYEPFSV